jgi:hypothetical protein
VVAGGRATVCLGDDGVVYVGMLPGTKLDDTDARAIMSAVNAACNDRRRPVLVDLTGLESITHAARWVFSVPSRVAGQALFGASPVERVIASFFMKLNKMPCPTAFFARRESAVEWLRAVDWGSRDIGTPRLLDGLEGER